MKHDHTGSRLKKGYAKINFTCEQALLDGFRYAWVDTCCIDKTSSSELSESLNSMFRWYKNADSCYAYLSDVTATNHEEEFPRSRWFTRGWTLQELLAPAEVTFYDKDWRRLGTKTDYAKWIHDITKIDMSALVIEALDTVTRVLKCFCSAQKMAWASRRRTTREEDLAYSLLGIFNVSMPLLYGEGHGAFIRLQEEIIRQSGDDSILAWNFGTFDPFLQVDDDQEYRYRPAEAHFLAHGPYRFKNCSQVQHPPLPVKMELTNLGLQLEVPILRLPNKSKGYSNRWLAVLSCRLDKNSKFVGIILNEVRGSKWHFRAVSLGHEYVHATAVDGRKIFDAPLRTITIMQDIFFNSRSLGLNLGTVLHVLISLAQRVVTSDVHISTAKLVETAGANSGSTEDVNYIWDPTTYELVFIWNDPYRFASLKDLQILLWVTPRNNNSEPLYRIQICTSCGRYVVNRWHSDLHDKDEMPGHIHAPMDTDNISVPDCVFKVTTTKKDICQRPMIMVNIDLGESFDGTRGHDSAG